MVKKSELIDGAYYRGDCRNASIARWNGKKQIFVIMRRKFNFLFPEEINHPDDEKKFDVFYPEKLETKPDIEIPYFN